jgi:N-acetylmuramoyl-L-alanine amidase
VLNLRRAFHIGGVLPVLAAIVAAAAVVTARPATQGATPVYTVISANGRRALPYRTSGGTDQMPLDQLAGVFDFRVQEDPQAGGIVVIVRGQRVLLTPGQPLASVGARIVSLSGPVQRDGQTLYVPVDFLARALGPASGQRIEVRRGSRLIIVGDLRVPQVAPRFERQGSNGRLIVDVQPPAPHRTTREGNRLQIRFEADALDLTPMTAPPADFLAAGHVDGPMLVFDLGASAATIRPNDADPARVVVDFQPAAAPPTPGVAPPDRSASAPPIPDLTPASIIRIVAIDPGHGGDDAGVRGAAGAVEKDLTLQAARRLKSALESRLGLRVLLTRDADASVPIDRRTAVANNNKADLLVSLHANASFQPSARGAQVLSLGLEDYKARARGLPVSLPVPVVGGGTRIIDAMPWDLAQIPHAPESASLAAILVRHLSDHGVPLYVRKSDEAPLRVLVGANMPAVLVEMGFLSNADDERALAGGDVVGAIVEAIVGAITETRNGIPSAAAASEPQR